MANDNTQGAPAPADNATATAATATSTAEGTEAGAKATDNTGTEPAAFDPRTSYDSLKANYDNLNKSYGELRRSYTQSTQGYSELKKQLDVLTSALKEATREEVSPEDFMKTLQTQGLKALDPLREQWTNDLKTDYNKQIQELHSARIADRVEIEVMKRRLDSTRFPDFAKLEPVMQEIANSENCPVDFGQDIGVIYDTLYKLAKASSAENAIKEARAQGLKEAEGKIAREAGTAVATGGKAASTTNPADIKDLSKLREFFVAQLGEAE